ncbi:unnamed protein product [Rhodiola kirilowii]
MALIAQLQKQYLDYVASLFNEEVLDEQFIQVHRMKNESNPNLVINLASAFFRDSEKLINSMSEILEKQLVDFRKVYEIAQQLRGSSSIVGAAKIKNICAEFRNLCDSKNVEMMKRYVQQMQFENSVLKSKLDTLFRLEKQIQASGGAVPALKLKNNIARSSACI